MRRSRYFWSLWLLAACLLLAPAAGLAAPTSPADTTPPAAPTGLHAIHTTYSYIAMAWNPNDEPDLDRYEIYRARWCGVGVGFWSYRDQVRWGNTYVDTGVLSECVYWYYIVAIDTSGNYSLPSDTIEGETFPDGLQLFYLPVSVAP